MSIACRNVAAFCAGYDIVLTPTLALPPVPVAWEGLPIGVQLIASAPGKPVLLRVSAQIEAARPWADRRAPVD
jgi:amidase